MKVIEGINYRFPQSLERRLDAILSSVNIETKQITLAFCLDHQPRTSKNLREIFSTYVNEETHWVPNTNEFYALCYQTFVPIGRIVEGIVAIKGKRKKIKCWKIKKSGEKYAKPIAAFSLKYAVDHDRSLFKYLGQTQSKGDSRPCYNRSKILELVKNGYQTEAALSKELGLAQVGILKHLSALKNIGLIDFSTAPRTKGRIRFKWTEGKPEDVKTVRSYTKLTYRVSLILYECRGMSINPLKIRKILNYDVKLDSIYSVLYGLEKQGFVVHEKWVGGKQKVLLSDVQILPDGIEFIENYIEPVRNALQDRKELEDMEGVLFRFHDSNAEAVEYSQKGMDLYKAVSPLIKRKDTATRIKEILEIMASYQQRKGYGPRPMEIEAKLGVGPEKYLKILLKKGVITKNRRGRVVRYSLIQPTLN